MKNAREPHPIQRVRERYGVEMSLADLRAVARKCHAGKSVLTRIDSSGAEHRLVKFAGQIMVVIYDRSEGRILTFAPPSHVKGGGLTERMFKGHGWKIDRQRLRGGKPRA